MGSIKLSELIAPGFADLHRDIKEGRHTHYWLKGGRGSTKSSCISVELVLGLMRDAGEGCCSNALVLRRYGVTLRETVYEQVGWAINALGVGEQWQPSVAPLCWTYKPTGQKILFRGADKPSKLKSIKISRGYIKYIWYEEVDEFEGTEKLRSINQSVLRGGSKFLAFYSFNPPHSQRNWVNQEVQIQRADSLVHHSTYLSVPPAWLGDTFRIEAEHLKAVNELAYRHEYLGEVTGSGGEVFANVQLRAISDQEIAAFDHLRRGIDWGYAVDPFAYNVAHYDKTRRRLYVYYEIHKVQLSNRAAAQLILPEAGRALITCDSAEPKSIDEMKSYGLRVQGAKKGPDSVAYGIKWLQDLEAIIIDPIRCPESAKEFSTYELERDREGNFKADFPDKNNHHIDALRYACEEDMRQTQVKIIH